MIANALQQSLLITAFVFVMMLIIEYFNILSRGRWQSVLITQPATQYLLAAFLGATPGCLGAFAAVAMYSHGVVSLGALVAAMIATSGDESFVMLAMFPKRALLLTGILFIIGLLAGWLTDLLLKRFKIATTAPCDNLTLHEADTCGCFPGREIIDQWRSLSLGRASLTTLLLVVLGGVATGVLGPPNWNWVRLTILSTVIIGLFITVTVPEHFLQSHLWNHIARRHIPRVFLWTFGALLLTNFVTGNLSFANWITHNQLHVLLLAALVGIIPESGPHLVFVTLFAKGAVSFAILLTSSIVQDGHGMLPLLGHSRRDFVVVKLINLAAGLAVGLAWFALNR